MGIKEVAMFAWLVIDGHNYGAVVTASGVYPDGVYDYSAPVYYVYSLPLRRCTGVPRYTGRESILKLNGQSIPVVTAEYDEARNTWSFRTYGGNVRC